MISKFRVVKSFRDKRERDLASVKALLNESSSVVLLSHGPIKALQNLELRQKLSSMGARFKVVKCSIAKIAASTTPLAKHVCKGVSLGMVFSSSADPVLLVRTIRSFTKQDPKKLGFLGGLIQNVPLGAAEVEAVAEMQTADQLYAQVIRLLSAPAERLIGMINSPSCQIVAMLKQYCELRKE